MFRKTGIRTKVTRWSDVVEKQIPTLYSELDILISTAIWVVQNGWELEAISIPRGARRPSVEAMKEEVRKAFQSKNIKFAYELFKPMGPDIVARSDEVIWKIECKGLGKGKPQTIRNNFDRAVASAVSYFDTPGTRIGIALANDYLWAFDFGPRLPRTLRETINLWVFLLENGTLYPYEPYENLPCPGAV